MINIAALLIACLAVTAVCVSPCDEATRATNIDDCLQNIRDAVNDRQLFWFGTDYSDRCPTLRDSLDCYTALPDPGYGFSLAQRVFGNDFDPSTIDRYLSVMYDTPELEDFEACNHVINMEATQATVYPLAGQSQPSVVTRTQPTLSWDYQEGDRFTVVFLDPETLRLLWLVTNIPGDSMGGATVDAPYSEPLAFRSVSSPFLFIVYTQSSDVMLNDDWRAMLDDPGATYDVNDLATEYGLSGPVALSWVLVSADAYGIQRVKDSGLADNCASLVTEALNLQNLSFASPDTTLPMSMTVSITTTPFDYTYCCKTNYVQARTLTLDPLGNMVVDPAEVRTDAVDITATVSKTKINPDLAADFTGRYFTLLCGDISVPFATAGTRNRPLLHWLMTNLQVDSVTGQLKGGVTVQTYRGPMPPDVQPHYYVFLLYQQPDRMAAAPNSSAFTGACSGGLVGRCLFDVAAFATSQGSQLSAASWMVAENNDYVNLTRGVAENEACAGRSGYSDPCPDGSTNDSSSPYRVSSALVVLILGVMMAYRWG